MGRAGLFGRDTTNHLSSVVKSLLSLESSLISSHTLADDLGILVDPDIGDGAEAAFDNFRQHWILKILLF